MRSSLPRWRPLAATDRIWKFGIGLMVLGSARLSQFSDCRPRMDRIDSAARTLPRTAISDQANMTTPNDNPDIPSAAPADDSKARLKSAKLNLKDARVRLKSAKKLAKEAKELVNALKAGSADKRKAAKKASK